MILATVKMCLRRFKIVLIIYGLFGLLAKKKEASIAKVAEPMINFTSENILRFIKKFSDFGNQVVECFTKGNCFWFATVLAIEFAGEIYYDPIVGHFATMIGGVMYDIAGVVKNTRDFISIEEIYEDELLWARLQRDCVDLGVGMEYEV